MMFFAFGVHYWKSALNGDVCMRCLQPGHVSASCRDPFWGYRE